MLEELLGAPGGAVADECGLPHDDILRGPPGGAAAEECATKKFAGAGSKDNILGGGAKRLLHIARPASRIRSMEFG